MSNYFTGKITGSLDDLEAWIKNYTLVQRFLFDEKNYSLLLCYQLMPQGDWKNIPWAQIKLFLWDDGTIEILDMWVEQLKPYESQGMGDEDTKKMQERFEMLERISESIQLKFAAQPGISNPEALKPTRPNKPKKIWMGGALEEWFAWYHAMNNNGFKCTLKNIEDETGYDLDYLKHEHSRYKNEHGLS